jgi:hypothetical protein
MMGEPRQYDAVIQTDYYTHRPSPVTQNSSRFAYWYWPRPKYSQHVREMVMHMRRYDRFGQTARAR